MSASDALPTQRSKTTADASTPAAKRGRPVFFDDARRREFCNFLRLGCTISKAASLVGLSRRAINYAARRDPDLAQHIRLARQESRVDPMNKIANSKSWRAAAWLLERRSREYRLPRKRCAARQAGKMFGSKSLRRQIRRMVEELLHDPSQFTRDGK